ncbi:hypothetical protein [Desulfospira joergensenii]|uniref:hypothetical protein n=1 Tax=Desulfospira joergensenii TaxID=53329 RepID=UPI0003B6BF75|nr:hypothetical protein [Desulfospira joergensenii]
MVDTNKIQLLINCLGDGDTLLDRIDPYGQYKAKIILHQRRANAKTDQTIGLHYSGAHWYARMPNGDLKDSYTEKYQIDGTAHFCQSFAAMIFLKDDRLKPNEYADNIKKAVEFWIEYIDGVIKQGSAMKNWLLRRLQVSDKDLTLDKFRELLDYASDNADSIKSWH